MVGFSLSYSTIEDVYACVDDTEDAAEKAELRQLATDLEQTGIGHYNGTEYMYRPTRYGMEVVSMEDFASESDDEEE